MRDLLAREPHHADVRFALAQDVLFEGGSIDEALAQIDIAIRDAGCGATLTSADAACARYILGRGQVLIMRGSVDDLALAELDLDAATAVPQFASEIATARQAIRTAHEFR
jgi:hypothetical protein